MEVSEAKPWQDIVASVITYSAPLRILEKGKLPEQSLELFAVMQ